MTEFNQPNSEANQDGVYQPSEIEAQGVLGLAGEETFSSNQELVGSVLDLTQELDNEFSVTIANFSNILDRLGSALHLASS